MAPSTLLTSRAVIGEFYNRLAIAPANWIDRYAMRIQSSQDTENYAWLGQVPTMREWIGGRLAKDLPEYRYSLRNKDHEATLEINVKDMKRDKSGQIMVRIGELAQRALSYPAKLMSTLIANGESTVCYDGQFFFDTDHSEGASGSQSNDLTFAAATGTTPTVPEMRDAIMASIQAIVGFKDDVGEPMNEGAATFEVMVPIALLSTALSAVNLPVIDQGAANIISAQNAFSITVVPNARLTDATKFYTFRTDGQTKPFIIQEEEPLQIDAIAEGSELEFKERKHWYGVLWAGNVGYGFWQHGALTTFT